MQETWVQSLGWEDPMGKEVATHSSILPGKSHGQRSLAGYSPWGPKRAEHNLVSKQQLSGKRHPQGHQWNLTPFPFLPTRFLGLLPAMAWMVAPVEGICPHPNSQGLWVWPYLGKGWTCNWLSYGSRDEKNILDYPNGPQCNDKCP